MSIISDALKKAQEEKNKNKGSIPVVNLPIKEEGSKKKNDTKTLKILAVVLILAALSALGLVKFGKATAPKKQKHPVSKIEYAPTSIQDTAEVTAPAPEPPENIPEEELQLELTGILFDAASPLAIINGSMVRRGDRINDAKIIEIEPQRVKLNYRGKELFISLP